MENIGVVVCLEGEAPKPRKKGIMDYIREFLASFKKFEFEVGIKEVGLENYSIFLLSIPFKQFEIQNLKRPHLDMVKQTLTEKLGEKEILMCEGDKRLFEMLEINTFQRVTSTGRKLYKYLLFNILSKIYDERGYDLGDLDITIIDGGDRKDLFSVIRLLSQKIKYITVVTKAREDFEKDADAFCDETGLAIRATNDLAGGVKDADLIINLGDIHTYSLNSKVKSKALIINLGEWDDTFLSGNVMVNGIKVALPKKIASQVDSGIYKYINELQIAEMDFEYTEPWTYEEIYSRFRNKGYIIKGLAGRRNTLKIEDIWGGNNYTAKSQR
ncbi:MAG: hypothetical protein N2645_21375 [Clostridia bacterium]|nr:hypothetical protein [Clostridia bacterium]